MQNPNQFKQSAEKGLMDLRFNPTVISCQIDESVGATLLLPGQAVKVVDSAGGVPKVVPVTAPTDDVFGFLMYNIKDKAYKAGQAVEVVFSRGGSVMYMEAGAAIARNAKVMVQVAGEKVITAAGAGNVVVGRALDKAAGNGDLVRVVIDLPGEVLV